jgi:hypothetical protein
LETNGKGGRPFCLGGFMKLLFKKLWSVTDIKYGWIITLSFLVFLFLFYIDLRVNRHFIHPLALVGYGLAFVVAVVWSILNYISHIKINVLFKQSSDIDAFLSQLTISRDEKVEIKAYLEDYIVDLMENGQELMEATKEAIEAFKVKEMLSLSKNTALLNLPAHYYLLGIGVSLLILGLFTRLLELVDYDLFLLALEWLFYLYGVGCIGLFFAYKLLDIVLYKKIKG